MYLEFVILGIVGLSILFWGYAFISSVRKLWVVLRDKRKRAIVPTLVVGNITVGGTGKTPFLLYLSDLFLGEDFGIVSRGYGRRSKGFQVVETDSRSLEVGDEPLEIKRALSEKGYKTPVVVGEKRLEAIENLVDRFGTKEFVLLDDGLQHVHLEPEVGIVLTTYSEPLSKQIFSLPLGKLREFAFKVGGYDFLVVTKCPVGMDDLAINEWWLKHGDGIKMERDRVFFAEYGIKCGVIERIDNLIIGNGSRGLSSEGGTGLDNWKMGHDKMVRSILITAVVNTDGIEEFLQNDGYGIDKHFKYSDHYYFDLNDLRRWIDYSKRVGVEYWFTTRKDWQRMKDLLTENAEIIPLDFALYIGIVHTNVRILEGKEEEFKNVILKKLKENKR